MLAGASAAQGVLPVDRWLRRLGWLGTAAAAALVAWLVAGRAALGVPAARPPLVVVGWELLRATVELGGHADQAFRLGLWVLWLAAPLALATRGFSSASLAGQAAVLAVGVAGLAAAVPVAAVVAVLAANLAIWGVGIALGALLLFLLLLRVLSAPFRRW